MKSIMLCVTLRNGKSVTLSVSLRDLGSSSLDLEDRIDNWLMKHHKGAKAWRLIRS